jgi:hypothetical protein
MTVQQYNWSDLYGDSPTQEVPLDDAGQSLIQLLPEHKRAEMEPMLRGMLSSIRAQLGPELYVKFVADMRLGYEYHCEGKTVEASELFAAYGMPYEMLIQQLES